MFRVTLRANAGAVVFVPLSGARRRPNRNQLIYLDKSVYEAQNA